MYNKEIKEAFIKASYGGDATRKNVEKTFNNFAQIEEAQNKDVYYISYTELIECVLENSRISSYKKLYDQVYYAKKYKEWCLINGIFDHAVSMNYLEINSKQLHQIYSQFISRVIIKTPEEFQVYLDAMFTDSIPADDFMSRDDFAKMYVLLLYEGISSPEEIYELKVDDIHIAPNGVFIRSGDTMPLVKDKELQRLLKKRAEKPIYGYFRGSVKKTSYLSDNLIDFGSNVKDVKKTMIAIKVKKLDNKRLYDLNPNYKTAMTDNSLYICGMMYKIKEDENIKGRKFKKKELMTYFSPKFTSSRWRKEQIIEIYNVW